MFYIVYPIFINTIRDGKLLNSLLKNGLAWRSFQNLSDNTKYKIVVLTDNIEIEDMACKDGVVVKRCENIKTQNQNWPFPIEIIADILINEHLDMVNNLFAMAIVDFRCPDITSLEICKILNFACHRQGVCVGLFEPEDHPAQFYIYLETITTELHLRVDDEAGKNRNIRVSKPFPIWIPQSIILDRIRFFRIPSSGICSALEPVSDDQAIRESGSHSGIVYECSPDGFGRRIVKENVTWPINAFLPFGGCLTETNSLVRVNLSCNKIELYLKPLPPGNYRLRLYSVDSANTNFYEIFDGWMQAEENPDTVLFANNDYIGPVVKQDDINDDCVAVVLERQVNRGHADNRIAVPIDEGGWKIGDNGICINTQTNKEILGRQDFPEIFEFNGALIALTPEHLKRLLQPDFINQAFGFKLPKRSAAGRAIDLGMPFL